MMADTQASRHAARLTLAAIPEDVRKRLTPAELARRCAYAADLSAKAAAASDVTLRRSYRDLAALVLKAAPADEVAARHRALLDRAGQMSPGPERDLLLRDADDLVARNPQPPGSESVDAGGTTALGDPARDLPPQEPPSRVTKATKTLHAVHDAQGKLTHVVDPKHLVPVVGGPTNGSRTAPADGGEPKEPEDLQPPTEVAKASPKAAQRRTGPSPGRR